MTGPHAAAPPPTSPGRRGKRRTTAANSGPGTKGWDTPMEKIEQACGAGRIGARTTDGPGDGCANTRRNPGPTEHAPNPLTGRRYPAVADGSCAPLDPALSPGVSPRGGA